MMKENKRFTQRDEDDWEILDRDKHFAYAHSGYQAEKIIQELNELVETNRELYKEIKKFKKQREELFIRERNTKNKLREIKEENQQLRELLENGLEVSQCEIDEELRRRKMSENKRFTFDNEFEMGIYDRQTGKSYDGRIGHQMQLCELLNELYEQAKIDDRIANDLLEAKEQLEDDLVITMLVDFKEKNKKLKEELEKWRNGALGIAKED